MNHFANKRLLAKAAIVLGVVLLIFSGIIILNRILLKDTEDTINYDCKDFSYQEEAQNYFISQGGSSTKNVDNLDADNNGIACESLSDLDTNGDGEIFNFLENTKASNSTTNPNEPTFDDLANGRINPMCLTPTGEFDLGIYIQASDSGIDCFSY